MTIIEDTRQQKDKHKLKEAYFADNGITVVRSKLPVGDYANIKDLSVVIDTKANILELVGNVTQQHRRFVAECDLAENAGIKLIILVENNDGISDIEDLNDWKNPRLKFSAKATTGERLAKILHGIEVRHGVTFMFCTPKQAGAKVIELLTRKGE